MSRNRRSDLRRRRLGHEFLEPRCLLAGLESFAWQNPLSANDLDADGIVAPSDALAAINALNGGLGGELALHFAPPALYGQVVGAASEFLDSSGDGKLSPLDPLLVINELNARLAAGVPSDDLPAEDQQPGDIDDPTVPELTLVEGAARVRAKLNQAGDVDVFRVMPTKSELGVVLFAPRESAVTVEILDAEGLVIGSATTGAPAPADDAATNAAGTPAGESSPPPGNVAKPTARVHVGVTPTETYYLRVSGGPEVTGVYGLHVLNFDERDFKPKPDAELGNDIHGDELTLDDPNVSEDEWATELALTGRQAQVRSNIDTVGDRDVFAVEAQAGKLIVQAGAEFGLTVEVFDADGHVVLPQDHANAPAGARRPVIVDVTAGLYFVAVKAADGTSIGVYGMHVVNAPPPPVPPPPDAELGDDIHGDEATLDDPNVSEDEWATELALTGRQAQVHSNIDTAGDRDVFAVEAQAGKLVVRAGAEFGLTVEVFDADGQVVPPQENANAPAGARRPVIVSVTAGLYFVSVKAADGTSVGVYHMHVANATPPPPPPVR